MNDASFISHLLGSNGPTNVSVVFNMFYALLMGLLFGYERFYHGRAAGMRTYGLVCMVAAILTSASCAPSLWFSGHTPGIGIIDPTRTIQGIVTGIGFLGAGIIMQDGLKISGLTTAASIWSVAAIGVLCGLGLHLPATFLTLFSMGFMMWGAWAASMLPYRKPLSVTLLFKRGHIPEKDNVKQFAIENGYEVAHGTIEADYKNGQIEWRFVAVSLGKNRSTSIWDLSQKLPTLQGVDSFQISRARN